MADEQKTPRDPDPDMILLGQILKDCRQHLNRPQSTLAALAQMDESYLSSLENGRYNMTLRKFFALCRALDTTPRAILNELERRRLEPPTDS